MIKRLLWWTVGLIVLPAALLAAWLAAYAYVPLGGDGPPQFNIRHGSSLRSATRQMQAAGVISTPLQFEILARIAGHANRIQAGNYALEAGLAPLELLRKITSGDQRQDQITFVEGWAFTQVRAALDAHPALRHDTHGIADTAIAAELGIDHPSAEGTLFPDTYYFAYGTSDLTVLRRAARNMQAQLEALWSTRAQGLPLSTPYQALILASIIEKETGQAQERAMIGAVFVNRLKLGMLLQTDPSVIYGLGSAFDGNLRKRDLQSDGPYNTYTRPGLPPTPIAMPGLAALNAALNPAPSKALYFVARGNGTSQFSNSLAEHERAVTRYQRAPAASRNN